jgi:hypothetical protein
VSGAFSEPVPLVARVLLRVEWADGQVREFDADQPYDLDVRIGHPMPCPRYPGEAWTEHPLAAEALWGGDAISLAVTFKANRDSYRHPFTIRDPEAQARGNDG